jgi:low temperature requirement protein LtrA
VKSAEIHSRAEPAEPSGDRAVRVSTLELFFDLVFVFTVTQLTGVLADDPSWTGLAKVVLLLSIIWWIYDGYVWLTNAVALDVLGHRILLLGGMAGFLVMALAIPTTFGDGGVAFGLGYLAVVALHGWLYIRATSASEAEAIRGIVPYNVAAALMLVAAGIVKGDAQWALIVAPAVLLWLVPYLTTIEGFQVSASHFVERHGLVVIVALGESIVVLGVGAGGAEVGFELGLIALLAFALSASLWWTYFSHEEPVEAALLATPTGERPRLALLMGYVHFFLLLGVVLVAAGLKKAIPDPLGDFGWESALILPVGTAMFVAADTADLRLLGIPFERGRLLAVVAVLATIPVGLFSAAAQVAMIVLIMAVTLPSGQLHVDNARPTAR